tara:strand:- start:2781 stop:3923 length:1143 start_codon:yes stop_codon:yes gene_type:complete
LNKQKFIELLNNPGDLKEVNLNELDDLVAENPYFQAARVLEAKGHRLLKSKVAGRKTASAAVYSTNRILLKKYLASDGIKVEKPVVTSPKPIEEKPKPTVRPVEKKAEQTPTPTPQDSETPSPAVTRAPKSSEGSSSIDQLIYNLHKDMEELEKSRAKYIEVSRKIEEEEAVEKAVKKATRVTEKAEPKPKAETTKSTARSSGSATKAKTTTSRTKTAGEKKSTTKKATTSKSATKSVAKPKASTSKTATAKKATTNSSTRKTSPKTTAKKSSSKTAKTTKSAKSNKSTKKDDHDGENQHQLIDEFIKKNPSFKPAQDSGEQQDLSAPSTSLPEDVGTEYLAEIFLNQGKKDKALKIYNSLMLRFPEKKAYFAGRIKKIK